MNKQQAAAVASGRATGKTDSQREQLEWKRRQALQVPAPRPVEPTLPERINRLSPFERHELQTMIRSMKLRKIIKRTLAEAFWQGEQQKALKQLHDDCTIVAAPRLRAARLERESMTSYGGVSTHFEPIVTQQPTTLEIAR